MLDIIIKNGLIIDGTGKAGKLGNIGVQGDRIEEVFAPEDAQAKVALDATGLVIAPGFIDVHTHADVAVFRTPELLEKLTQGVTSIIVGQCGTGLAPLSKPTLDKMRGLTRAIFGDIPLDPSWETVSQYRSEIEKRGVSLNIGYLIPHGALRAEVMGFSLRRAKSDEITKMCRICADAMEEGAVGFSTGLSLAPSAGADANELVELTKVISSHGGFLAIHMRGKHGTLLDPLQEAIEIARRSSVALHINHLLPPPHEAGKANEMLLLIDQAISEGLDITIDRYPYTFGSGELLGHFPLWVQEGTPEQISERLRNPQTREKLKTSLAGANIPNWSAIVISAVGSEKNHFLEGYSVKAIADRFKKDPVDFACDLLIEESLFVLIIRTPGDELAEELLEGDMRQILQHSNCIVASDSIHLPGKPHPRTYGTFPRYLGRYVRQEGLETLEAGVRKCTSLPAERLGLKDRGIIRQNAFADLVIFDPSEIIDRATISDGTRVSRGIKYVIVNGSLVFCHGEYKGIFPGRWLQPE